MSTVQDIGEKVLVDVLDSGFKVVMFLGVPLNHEYGTQDLHGELMKLLNFSRTRYYLEAGFFDARRRANMWNDGARTFFDPRCTVSSKWGGIGGFVRGSHKRKVPHADDTWQWFM
jgi:hypothetical protein